METVNPSKSSSTSFAIETTYEGSGWKLNGWNSTVDKNALFISDNFSVTNNTGTTQAFTFEVASGIPSTMVNRMIQSTVDVTLTDTDGTGGAQLTTITGFPIYDGRINDVTALELLDDPLSLTCSDPVDCLFNGRAAAGIVSQSVTSVIANEIGIFIKFTLSPGDSADVLSRFQVIPERNTGFLLVMGLIGLALQRRRRAGAEISTRK